MSQSNPNEPNQEPAEKIPPKKEPWYKDGLRFTCTGCGDCCTGAPGYVWVSEEESQAFADHLEMTVEEFCAQYTRKVGRRRTLVELPESYDCVFLHPTTRKCTVYHLRPQQCRTWPFWGSNIRTEQAWEETCEVCPGSGQGELVPLLQIETQAAKIRM